jgi:hypothetical protein
MQFRDEASEVMGMMEAGHAPEISEIILMVIANIISAVVSKCILDRMKANKPSMYQRMKLWSYVKAESRPHSLTRSQQTRIYDALLKKGTLVTDEDISKLISNTPKGTV